MNKFKISLMFFLAAFSYFIVSIIWLQHVLRLWELWSMPVRLGLIIIPMFIYGFILTIFGLYYTIRDYREINLEKLIQNLKSLGGISLIIGLFSLLLIYFHGLLLIISGIFMIYFSFKDEDYFNSSSFTSVLVVFLSLSLLTLYSTIIYYLVLNSQGLDLLYI